MNGFKILKQSSRGEDLNDFVQNWNHYCIDKVGIHWSNRCHMNLIKKKETFYFDKNFDDACDTSYY